MPSAIIIRTERGTVSKVTYTPGMRAAIALAIAAAGLSVGRGARVLAERQRDESGVDEPFAPSPDAAPYVSLGYREMAADLMWIRLTGYFGGNQNTARGIGGLVDAITTLDPSFHRVYEWGARAMTLAREGVDNSTYLHAIDVLQRGMKQFPDDWRLPYLAGQIYTQDLETKDAAQRRAWDEKGTLLIESAIRKPGAPAEAAEWAAVMRTKLGEHERAVRELREMLLVTQDSKARDALIKRLATLENSNADELAAEILETRKRFDAVWQRERPSLPASMYILLGPHIPPRFDMTDLATAGHDLIGSEPVEKLEPVE
jgi:hypothetical protein